MTAGPVTSMCLQIAAFDHEDCPGGWCACACHKAVGGAT